MAFNRVFREFRTWKHYRGGMADDIWIYDFKTGTTENLTNNPAQDICPMWGPDNQDLFHLRSRRPHESVLDRSCNGKETKQLTTSRISTSSFHRSARNRLCSSKRDTSGVTISPAVRQRRSRSRSRRISHAVASALVDASKHIESVNLAPDGAARRSWSRAAIFSRSLQRTERRATDARLPALTSVTRFGRRMENGLPTTRMSPARTSFTFAPRTAKASRSR